MTSPIEGPGPSDWMRERRFIDSSRARFVCTRELAKLRAGIAQRVEAMGYGPRPGSSAIRSSPDRYIAQVGPVALTVAWLRGKSDSVGDGELLVIVWRGAVAERASRLPESIHPAGNPTAAVIWQEVIVASADGEDQWRWCPLGGTLEYTSDQLAQRCVDELERARSEVSRAAG